MVDQDTIPSKLAPLLQEIGVTAMAAILETVISHSVWIQDQDQDHTALDQALDHTALDQAQDHTVQDQAHTVQDLAQDHTALDLAHTVQDLALDHTGLDPVIVTMEVPYPLEDLATQTLIWMTFWMVMFVIAPKNQQNLTLWFLMTHKKFLFWMLQ